MEDYKAAINELFTMGMIYQCFCSRSEIKAEIMRAGNAPHEEDYSVYPGTCRRLSVEERKNKIDQKMGKRLRQYRRTFGSKTRYFARPSDNKVPKSYQLPRPYH